MYVAFYFVQKKVSFNIPDLIAGSNKLSFLKKLLSHIPKTFVLFVSICFNGSSLKMMKITFYFVLKAGFVLKIFKFLS